QNLQELIGGVHADVGLQQQLFELVPERIVDRPRLLKNRRDPRKDAFTRLFDAFIKLEPTAKNHEAFAVRTTMRVGGAAPPAASAARHERSSDWRRGA